MRRPIAVSYEAMVLVYQCSFIVEHPCRMDTGSRRYILRSAGRLLVVQEPSVKSADIIVVAIDADGAGALEAADLVHRGVSNRVAVFDEPPSSVDREFLRRGLPYEDRAAISTRQLQSLGIQNVEQIPRSTSGSEQEGEILPNWCDEHGYHSVGLVTLADHSRRLTRNPPTFLARPSAEHDGVQLALFRV